MNEFINTGIDYAITMYLRSKTHVDSPLYNSFLVMVVRTLVYIYGEDKIIDPYSNNAVHNFKDNLERYGYKKFDNFKNYIQRYYEWAKNMNSQSVGKNNEFVLIQEELIDMMILRLKNHDSEEERREFVKFLYIPSNPNQNMVEFNKNIAVDVNAVEYYWKKALFDLENKVVITIKPNNLLNPKYYNLFNLTLENIKNLSVEQIDEINSKIFAKLKVDSNEENFSERLDRAFQNYSVPDLELSSGSGFVDRMLLISILVTLVSIAFIAVVMIFR